MAGSDLEEKKEILKKLVEKLGIETTYLTAKEGEEFTASQLIDDIVKRVQQANDHPDNGNKFHERLLDVFIADLEGIENNPFLVDDQKKQEIETQLSTVAFSLGNCSTPFFILLAERALLSENKNKHLLPEEIDSLQTQMKLYRAVSAEFNHATDKISVNREDPIENVYGVALALLDPNMQHHKVQHPEGHSLGTPPLSINRIFALRSIEENQIEHFARLFCKTDQNNDPLLTEDRRYMVDMDKVRSIDINTIDRIARERNSNTADSSVEAVSSLSAVTTQESEEVTREVSLASHGAEVSSLSAVTTQESEEVTREVSLASHGAEVSSLSAVTAQESEEVSHSEEVTWKDFLASHGANERYIPSAQQGEKSELIDNIGNQLENYLKLESSSKSQVTERDIQEQVENFKDTLKNMDLDTLKEMQKNPDTKVFEGYNRNMLLKVGNDQQATVGEASSSVVTTEVSGSLGVASPVAEPSVELTSDAQDRSPATRVDPSVGADRFSKEQHWIAAVFVTICALFFSALEALGVLKSKKTPKLEDRNGINKSRTTVDRSSDIRAKSELTTKSNLVDNIGKQLEGYLKLEAFSIPQVTDEHIRNQVEVFKDRLQNMDLDTLKEMQKNPDTKVFERLFGKMLSKIANSPQRFANEKADKESLESKVGEKLKFYLEQFSEPQVKPIDIDEHVRGFRTEHLNNLDVGTLKELAHSSNTRIFSKQSEIMKSKLAQKARQRKP